MRFTYHSEFACAPDELFAFHERPDALELLTPPGSGMRLIQPAPNIHAGAEAVLSVPLVWPVRVRWIARHTVYEPPHRFVDEQIKGPFQVWRHQHIIRKTAAGAELIDDIEYELPLSPLSRLAGPLFIRPMLARMFRYRHQVTAKYCGKQIQSHPHE